MRYENDSFLTFATIKVLEQQAIEKGQIRYAMQLEDMPIESEEWQEITNAIENDSNRFEVVFRRIDQ